MIESKECRRCGQCLPLSMFSPSKRGLHGRQPYCKPCRSAYASAYNKRMRKFPDRAKAPGREEIWPRPLTEQLLDLNARKWRYPVIDGPPMGRL